MSKLFKPLNMGSVQLQHRVSMAPLTRLRADEQAVPLPMVAEYYQQRASVPGTFLISEATLISKAALSTDNIPAIYTDAQIKRWNEVTDAVHEKGSSIYCQLWHQGRAGQPEVYKKNGGKFVSASAIPMNDESPVPEEMTEDDIRATIQEYATAAKNAIKAGFDGIELHAANGYLIDQFLQDVSNHRTDAWGGSIEKRAKFPLEVTKAVVDAIGADKVGIRLSPFSDFQGMCMKDPFPQFEYFVKQLKPLKLAYLHLVEARISGNVESDHAAGRELDFLVKLWDNQSPIIVAGGFSRETALNVVDEKYKDYDIAVAFGRHFIANPDLPFRLEKDLPLTKYDRSTFYTPKSPEGYIDLPFSKEFKAQI
ncbi:NADH:flavin oxidoreductase/NADH oxidase [Xylariaceae sp. FL1019]|nr:NADH:flavin oxidoreductase/NADH oxidase [Xylariaceae sp. FL1019]